MTKLQKRFVSALAMIGAAGTAAWFGGSLFALLLIGVGAVMLWEWGRMVGVSDAQRVPFYALGSVAILAAAICPLISPLAIIVPAILCLGAFVFRPRSLGVGAIYVVVPIVVLTWLRIEEDFGFLAIALLFSVVWATDTFAMIFGKLLGGPLLWPSVSPKKTWAGAIGGLAAGGLLGAAVAVFSVSPDHWVYGLGIGCVLSVCAQAGDLAESAMKRACDVKDTSGIIPGHGGALDRMDGIVGASFCAGVWLVIQQTETPAQTLVLGG